MINVKKKICFGMTLYNKAEFLPAAVESLLNQTYDDFMICAIDDASTDETGQILSKYAAKDKRIRYMRNESRKGMIYTWRRAFRESLAYRPVYFAWASDHDIWHPQWLERTCRALDASPESVMAYSRTRYIDSENHVKDNGFLPIDTRGQDTVERIYSVCTENYQAGNAIYGLFRVKPLIKAGVFRPVLLPDKLLLTELSIQGSVCCIDEELWSRRIFSKGASFDETVEKQRSSLFGNQSIPFQGFSPYLGHVLRLSLNASLAESRSRHEEARFKELLAILYWHSHEDKIKNEVASLSGSVKERFAKSVNPGILNTPKSKKLLNKILQYELSLETEKDRFIKELQLQLGKQKQMAERFESQIRNQNPHLYELGKKAAQYKSEMLNRDKRIRKYRLALWTLLGISCLLFTEILYRLLF